MANRLAANPNIPKEIQQAYSGKSVPVLVESRLDDPLKLKKPAKIGVQFMGDLFHENVPRGFIDEVFQVMASARRHVFMVLTKRPQRMLRWVEQQTSDCDGYLNEGNVWLGVSAENQQRADERIPLLLEVPAAVRFVSLEPLLGPIDLGFGPDPDCSWCFGEGEWYADAGGLEVLGVSCQCMTRNRMLDWVIAGAETGPGARPAQLDWFRSLRDQCQEAGVPYFVKQVNARRERLLDGRLWEQYPGGDDEAVQAR